MMSATSPPETPVEEETLAMTEAKQPESGVGAEKAAASAAPSGASAPAAAAAGKEAEPLPAVVPGIGYNEMDVLPAQPAPARLDSQDSWMGALSRVSSALRSGVSEAARAVSAATAVGGRGVAPSFVLVGDQYTAAGEAAPGGWVARLRALYGARARMCVYAAPGYPAPWGTRLLLRALRDEADVKMAFLWFGAVDCVPGTPGYVPVPEYRLAIAKMALHCVNERVVPVLITPPPSGGELAAEREAYAAACRTIAEELRVPLVDAFVCLKGAGKESLGALVDEEEQLTEAGHEKVFSVVVATFDKKMRKYARDTLKEPFVLAKEVDPLDPDASLGVGL